MATLIGMMDFLAVLQIKGGIEDNSSVIFLIS